MSDEWLNALDGTAIMERMVADGWLYRSTNCARSDGVLVLDGNGYYCLFGQRKGVPYRYNQGCQADNFTEAVRGAAHKALERGW